MLSPLNVLSLVMTLISTSWVTSSASCGRKTMRTAILKAQAWCPKYQLFWCCSISSGRLLDQDGICGIVFNAPFRQGIEHGVAPFFQGTIFLGHSLGSQCDKPGAKFKIRGSSSVYSSGPLAESACESRHRSQPKLAYSGRIQYPRIGAHDSSRCLRGKASPG